MENLAKCLEALLFVHGEPMGVDRLAKLTERTKTQIQEALVGLDKALSGSALVLVWRDDLVQLATRPQFAKDVEVLVKEEVSRDLSRAAAETAAVIAYRGPMTRSAIDYIRGVNSSYTLRNLLIRGLIERKSNPKDSRTYIYNISIDFLKFLGLSRLEDLPGHADFAKHLQEFLTAKPKEN